MGETGSQVLLVEDDARVRGVLDRQLRTLGWDVIAVSSGHEAIAWFSAARASRRS